jgi:hypothetical protein
MNDLGFVCCFCNQSIESNRTDPCDVNILINWDKHKNKQHNQTFWCHLECFKNQLHDKIQSYLSVDLLLDDDESDG